MCVLLLLSHSRNLVFWYEIKSNETFCCIFLYWSMQNETNMAVASRITCKIGLIWRHMKTLYGYCELDCDTWTGTCSSGVATGGARGGRMPPLTAKKLPKIGKKRGKIRKNRKKKRKKLEEMANIRKVLSLCPSWQIGLAMLLTCRTPPGQIRDTTG